MNQHLQQFSQQLATWTQAIIEYGRTPFRRVDTYPHLDTEQGVLQPPLVFWINRQSMMAGGVLLLPDNNLTEELERGRSCASALGLRHFVTWESDRVRIWHVDKDQIKELRSFPLSSPSHPDTFRYLLTEILDELKLLAVLGAIPVTELSPCYFNNLFQTTLQQALPPMIKAYRGQRSETEKYSTEDADHCANEANRLLILQIISILWFNKVPDTILPEKLERTIEVSLSTLPQSLREALLRQTTIKPPQLPLETAVCFHHLLLRLQQLSWNQPTERARQSILHLAHSWYKDRIDNRQPAEIQLYPETLPLTAKTTVILSDSPVFLAATALLADIATLDEYKLYFGHLFQFDQSTLPTQTISGRLLNNARIKNIERHEYSTRLRLSWPNRHLKIKTGQPFWVWELIHLLGLCQTGQNLSLELPIELLRDSEHIIAWSLLCENFSFQELCQLDNGNIQFSLSAGKKQGKPFLLKGADAVRKIAPIADSNRLREQILLALALPTDIYRLLGEELIWPDHDGISEQYLGGWEFYRQSLLYQCLNNVLQYEEIRTPPKDETSIPDHLTNIPYPEPLLLNELKQFKPGKTTTDLPSPIDHFLANLLNCPAVAEIKLSATAKMEKTSSPGTSQKKEFKETITQQLLSHGIPNFPEQYLYFLDHPQTRHYTIAPPLSVKNSLLGQFELEDKQGQSIAGYGDELEQTLLLCSATGKTDFELPDDRYQLEQLLYHYKKDLSVLYKYLKNLCYSQVENSKSARRLIKEIWNKFNLPDPSWFKN